MTSDQLFTRARHLANKTGRTVAEALAELGRRGSRERQRRKACRVNIEAERKKAPPAYWWQQLD